MASTQITFTLTSYSEMVITQAQKDLCAKPYRHPLETDAKLRMMVDARKSINYLKKWLKNENNALS